MEPATLNQALHDICRNRLVAAVVHNPWASGGVFMLLAIGLGLFLPDYLCIVLAPPTFLLVALIGYFIADRVFVARVRACRPRCPSCKECIWQLMCDHCRQPVPHLALLYRGCFLAHCPHCDGGLAESDGSLRAWCHCCGTGVKWPRRHYSRPSVIEVELSVEMPVPPEGGWSEWAKDRDCQEFHQSDAGAFTMLYRVAHNRALHTVVRGSVMEGVNRIWIGEGVNPVSWSNALKALGREARSRVTLCFEGKIPTDVEVDLWRKVRGHVPRPDRG